MKKITKKIIGRLKRYIGHDIIRIRPTFCGDASFTGSPLTLLGFTIDGKMVVCHPSYTFEGKHLGTTSFELPIEFTDTFWISYKKALKAKGNPLNKWKGKKIRRTKPTKFNCDRSFMCEYSFEVPPSLVSASKHHVLIQYNSFSLRNEKSLLSFEFADPSELKLAE